MTENKPIPFLKIHFDILLKFWQSYNFAQLPCVDKQTDKLKESGENFKKCEHFQCNDLDTYLTI